MGKRLTYKGRNLLRDNSLSIVFFAIFLLTLLGQIVAGNRTYNQEQKDHGQPQVGVGQYLATGHFWEALTENWESEFLQMGMYVVLTAWLFQRGSGESKDPDKPERVDVIDKHSRRKSETPWPVRRGGWVEWVYSHSLSTAFFLLFALSFAMHALSGAREYSQDQMEHGEPAVSTLQYLGTSQFWFESFQNWQSEFFSIGVIIVLSIFLREKGSPESKPVDAPHSETGEG